MLFRNGAQKGAVRAFPIFVSVGYTWAMAARKTSLTLLVASLVGVGFIWIRGGLFSTTGIVYLVWNLFLAWIPYLITTYCIKKSMSWVGFVPLFLLWLVFFPNAPYMVTDIIHVASGIHHVWFDALIFFFFAWIALLLGILSLRNMHTQLRLRMSSTWSEIAVAAICVLTSFGIYLGRFERWNSWDIIMHPLDLFHHSYAIGTRLATDTTPLLFVTIFSIFFYTVYRVTILLTTPEQK